MAINMALVQARKERGDISQAQVARDLKMSRSYYNQIENGVRLPSLRLATKIARYFGRRVDELFPTSSVAKSDEQQAASA